MKIVPCLSATIAVLLMICGGIGFFIVHNFLGVRHPQNYFVVAACFLLK
ncbi:MAG: hypothetical protein HY738_03445 [Bacteroidia bacterium]|nr:hypothetical protein [Bacteroidia bacterium]